MTKKRNATSPPRLSVRRPSRDARAEGSERDADAFVAGKGKDRGRVTVYVGEGLRARTLLACAKRDESLSDFAKRAFEAELRAAR